MLPRAHRYAQAHAPPDSAATDHMTDNASTISPGQLAQVLEVSRMLALTTELEPLLRRIANACVAMLGCERATIFLYAPQAQQLWSKIALNVDEVIRIPTTVGIAGHVFTTNSVYNCPKCYDDPPLNREADQQIGV